MNVRELINYLTSYDDHGYGQAEIVTCYKQDNPLTDTNSVADALFIESMNGGFHIVLQIE
jgi:hypothetical protein